MAYEGTKRPVVAPLLGGRHLLRFWRADGTQALVVCSTKEHADALQHRVRDHNPADCYHCRPDLYPHPGGEP